MVFSVSRYISYCLPQTFACEALRGIMLRGWDITYMPVWRGFLVTIIWIVATYVIFKELVNRDKVNEPIIVILGTSVNSLIFAGNWEERVDRDIISENEVLDLQMLLAA